jgi:3',5'-cyclic AMP phosphodiesterase CpdA
VPVLAHLSDLHFGRTDATVVEALLEDLSQARPDLVVISGDLTQRARSSQFAEARTFLGRLPAPVLVVPGNHDLSPLYSPLNRLFRPRAKFQRHLPAHADRQVWQDDDMVVVGLDSTRHLRWKSGKLRSAHLDHIDHVLAGAAATACKVAFLHRPVGPSVRGLGRSRHRSGSGRPCAQGSYGTDPRRPSQFLHSGPGLHRLLHPPA